ncbi:MAG TPA: MarC family protein [Candidatus Eisenbacteria bacterium]|nr:MarC family protein [Candidatus Eisenbacteria bacterium]
MEKYFLAFLPIFVAVDALGMLPFFMSLTEGMERPKKLDLIWRSSAAAALIAVVFLFVGNLIFRYIGVLIQDFFIAGGAALFVLSIRDLLFPYGKGSNLSDDSAGIVPLAFPLIVGPAVMTTSLILLNSMGVFPTLASLLVNIALCAGVLYFSDFFSSLLGKAGSNAVSKIANLLLGAIGVMLMRRGVLEIIESWMRQRPY